MKNDTLEVTKKNLVALTIDQLKQELKKALAITAEHLQYLAAVWKELEKRGEDLSHLKTGLAGYLPMIASGQIDSNLIVKYAGRRTVLSALAKLPIEQQREIANDGHLTIVTLDENGKRHDIQRQIDQLSQAELFQAISDRGLRDPDKQFLLLSNKSPRKKSVKNTIRTATVEKHDNEIFFRFGSKRIKEDYLISVIAKQYGIDPSNLKAFLANDGQGVE